MRVLSIRQPYATLIVRGIKRFEARSRETSHRGPLLIHASSAVPSRSLIREIGQDREFFEAVVGQGWTTESHLRGLPRGAIIGLVHLVDTWSPDELESDGSLTGRDVALCGGLTGDPVLWALRRPREIRPMTIKGQLGIWTLPKGRERVVLARLEEAKGSQATVRRRNRASEASAAEALGDRRVLTLDRFQVGDLRLARLLGVTVGTGRDIRRRLDDYLLDRDLEFHRGGNPRVRLDRRLSFLSPGFKTISRERFDEAVDRHLVPSPVHAGTPSRAS